MLEYLQQVWYDYIMKEITYKIEAEYFSPYAQKSAETAGRLRPIEPCPLRTDYQRDRDRIIHCKAFRRLKRKTQVFLAPHDDHYRTRLTHTMEVTQIARTIARALRLNEDLAEAIALGHDLGHTPFGHGGERTLRAITGHFEHNEQSLRVVDVLENGGKGLNLTAEVRDGILEHRLDGNPSTLEGKVVSFADRIAYLNHDIDDAVRAGLITEGALPKGVNKVLGTHKGERINTLIMDVIKESADKPIIAMSRECADVMSELRDFMFSRVYSGTAAQQEADKADKLIRLLFTYFSEKPSIIPGFRGDCDIQTAVTDHIASMSDAYAVRTFSGLYLPKFWEEDV